MPVLQITNSPEHSVCRVYAGEPTGRLRSGPFWGWSFLIARIALVVALLLAASDQAMGSCGDYLHTRTSSPTVANSQRTSEQTDRDEQKSRVPCSGPECRSAPSSPLVPPATPIGSVRSSENAIAGFRLAIETADDKNAFVRVSSSHAARGFPPQIDVPPECV
jgi:hypothetical protein